MWIVIKGIAKLETQHVKRGSYYMGAVNNNKPKRKAAREINTDESLICFACIFETTIKINC